MPESPATKPLPVVTDENRPFWEGCRLGKLLLQRCDQCQQYQFYPRLYCMHCGSKDVSWVEASGRGKIYSYTVIAQNKSPEFAEDVPYNVALIELEEGPRMLSSIVGMAPDKLQIDLPVRVVFEELSDTISIPRFRAI